MKIYKTFYPVKLIIESWEELSVLRNALDQYEPSSLISAEIKRLALIQLDKENERQSDFNTVKEPTK